LNVGDATTSSDSGSFRILAGDLHGVHKYWIHPGEVLIVPEFVENSEISGKHLFGSALQWDMKHDDLDLFYDCSWCIANVLTPEKVKCAQNPMQSFHSISTPTPWYHPSNPHLKILPQQKETP